MNDTVTQQQIDEIIANGKIEVMKLGEKTTLVKFTSKEGFEIIETSSCVAKENYNEEIGKDICLERIKNKLWAFEGYCLQKELFNKQNMTYRDWLNSLNDEEFEKYLVKQIENVCISDVNKQFAIHCEKFNDNCRKCRLEFLKSNYLENPNS